MDQSLLVSYGEMFSLPHYGGNPLSWLTGMACLVYFFFINFFWSIVALQCCHGMPRIILEHTSFLCFLPEKSRCGDDIYNMQKLWVTWIFYWLAEAGSWWIINIISTSIERVYFGLLQNRIMWIISKIRLAIWLITAFKRSTQRTMGSTKKGTKCSLRSSIGT